MFTIKGIIYFVYHNWAYSLGILLISFILLEYFFGKKYGKYINYVNNIHWYILIGGAFKKWKTRFLALLCKEAQKIDKFVISNFANWYNQLRFSSLQDFQNILNDIMIISEYQNFDDQQIIEIYGDFWKEKLKEKIQERKNIRKKYWYIPYNWRFTEFFIAGDEFHAYFYSRDAMSNFSGKKKQLNITLHQVRHFNVQGAFATQEIDELDKKFRNLANFEIATYSKLGDIILGWDLYKYNINKKYKEDEKQFNKINKVPIFWYNGYAINNLISYINGHYFKWIFKIFKIKKVYSELKFFSKSNVNPNISIYEVGDLINKLNLFYKLKI